MEELIVSIERLGRETTVGMISGRSTDTAAFRYSEEYFADPSARALPPLE